MAIFRVDRAKRIVYVIVTVAVAGNVIAFGEIVYMFHPRTTSAFQAKGLHILSLNGIVSVRRTPIVFGAHMVSRRNELINVLKIKVRYGAYQLRAVLRRYEAKQCEVRPVRYVFGFPHDRIRRKTNSVPYWNSTEYGMAESAHHKA